MSKEQDKTLAGIQIAIQMEIDGKEYYLKASQESSNAVGKELLKSLAAAEDTHLQDFVRIYDALRAEKDWPIIIIPPGRYKGLETIFARATREIGTNVTAFATELDTIQVAMNMENKTFDYYTRHARQAGYETEKNFYLAVATEEKKHHEILLDYYEFLEDPAGWFVKKEHPSLDGG